MMEQLLDFLWECSMETTIIQAQRTDCRYKEAEAYAQKVQKQVRKKKFLDKHFQAIDKAISAQNNLAVEYGRLAYCQGFRDCVRLIVEAMDEKN
ncbi:hypothetical protein NXH76_15135 [Blautia schinkii]|nr:hypothetical protein [Blautia schinkii]